MKTLLTIFSLMLSLTLSCIIINIPTDYPTIQLGIDNAQETDTLLVQSGTYVENLNYNGKNITIASYFLTTQDSVYITDTIIDGNEAGSVVTFETNESNSAVLMGLTITNGSLPYGSGLKGGGIHCNQASPTLNSLKIISNYSRGFGGGISCVYANPVILNSLISENTSQDGSGGGGISCSNSSPTLTNLQIINNTALNSHGGGIHTSHNSNPSLHNVIITDNYASLTGGGFYAIYDSNPILENVIISNNSTYFCGGGLHTQYGSHPSLEHVLITGNSSNDRAGGIYCSGDISLSDVTITNNSAEEGGGIYFDDAETISFDPEERCNIYSNFATTGNDLYNEGNIVIEVIVDTFTVQTPSIMQAYPIVDFSFDIMNAYFLEVNDDLYVSPTGDDQNSGLSWDEPLKTIHTALTRIQSSPSNPNTIFLGSGIFSLETNNEFFPLTLNSDVSIIGTGQSETIISGSGNESIFSLWDVENITIQDMTISNGARAIYMEYCSNITLAALSITENQIDDYHGKGGGVYSRYSDLLLFSNLTISNNKAKNGGGVYFEYVYNSHLNNCFVKNNYSSGSGGGIAVCGGFIELNSITISDNVGGSGGGLSCLQQAQVAIDSVSIYNNRAGSGGGVYCQNEGTTLTFAADNSCSVYLNSAGRGNDICLIYAESIDVIVDTFTVISPTNFHIFPKENVSLDILHSIYVQENSDLYVSPTGDDTFSGLTSTHPLKTIHTALSKVVSDSLNPHTIYLDEGNYSAETSGECFPLALAEDFLTLQGDESNPSVLDGSASSTLISSYFSNNCTINDLILQNGSRAIYSWASELSLSDVKCRNNSSYNNGSTLYSMDSYISLNRVCMVNNNLDNTGEVLRVGNSTIKILNSTITDNYSESAINQVDGKLVIVNSVIRNDSNYEMILEGVSAIVSYSNLAGGETGINFIYFNQLNWLEGNIDADPLFGQSYYPPLNSPCVDAGTDYFEWDSEVILALEAEEYYGSAPDMGAYEFGFVGIEDDEAIPSPKLSLSQNYPNPFNPTTTISFTAINAKDAKVEIFNIKGQLIATLSDPSMKDSTEERQTHSVTWNGDDKFGNPVSSGIYYYKLNVNGKTAAVKKCILLK